MQAASAQADADAHAQVAQGARAVAFEAEDAFGGLDDRLDPLADAGDHRCLAGFVLAVGAHDRGAEVHGGGFEFAAGVALVGDDRFAAAQAAAEQAERDLALAAAWCPQCRRARCAVRGVEQVQPHAVEVARVAGAVSVAGGVADRVAWVPTPRPRREVRPSARAPSAPKSCVGPSRCTRLGFPARSVWPEDHA